MKQIVYVNRHGFCNSFGEKIAEPLIFFIGEKTQLSVKLLSAISDDIFLEIRNSQNREMLIKSSAIINSNYIAEFELNFNTIDVINYLNGLSTRSADLFLLFSKKNGVEIAKNQLIITNSGLIADVPSITKAYDFLADTEIAKNLAIDARIEAENARDGAVSAENQAETAKNGAIIAQTEAVVARNETVVARDEAVVVRNEIIENELPLMQVQVDEAIAIARGKASARVFADVAELDAWLAIEDNRALLVAGDNLFVVEVSVPDFWWDGNSKQILESEKCDLSNFYTKAVIDSLLLQKITLSQMSSNITSAISSHSSDSSAHSANITARISTHNGDSSAHSALLGQFSKNTEMVSSFSDHNSSSNAHYESFNKMFYCNFSVAIDDLVTRCSSFWANRIPVETYRCGEYSLFKDDNNISFKEVGGLNPDSIGLIGNDRYTENILAVDNFGYIVKMPREVLQTCQAGYSNRMSVYLGQNACYVNIGNSASQVNIANDACYVDIGNRVYGVNFADGANYVCIANYVETSITIGMSPVANISSPWSRS